MAALREDPLQATIWHNPACGTSRQTLAMLQDVPGAELTVIEYHADRRKKCRICCDRIVGLFLNPMGTLLADPAFCRMYLALPRQTCKRAGLSQYCTKRIFNLWRELIPPVHQDLADR